MIRKPESGLLLTDWVVDKVADRVVTGAVSAFV
jgi:hypothetical protein